MGVFDSGKVKENSKNIGDRICLTKAFIYFKITPFPTLLYERHIKQKSEMLKSNLKSKVR